MGLPLLQTAKQRNKFSEGFLDFTSHMRVVGGGDREVEVNWEVGNA